MRQTLSSSLRYGFTLIEILIVVVILGILAAITIPQFSVASEEATHTSVAEITRRVQLKITEQTAVTGEIPATVDPSWFAGNDLPVHPYQPDEPMELVVQDIPGKVELQYKVFNESRPVIFWYNQATGSFHTRVPDQGSNEANIELYIRVNHFQIDGL